MTDQSKTFYVSTAIAYVNAKAHLGHALEFVQADTVARYHRQLGEEVFFLTGVDEHGEKIARSAKEAGKDPQKFVDEISTGFRELKPVLNLSYDEFIRTSEPRHQKAAQALWKACAKDIYKAKYTGLYCVGCETFYSETEAVNGECPIHLTKLEKVSEENYFFKLSAYTDKLKEIIGGDHYKIVPAHRKNEIMAVIEGGLEDISISRSKDKLPWGVPVPGDSSQVMWVWFDALPNYISALGYPDGDNFKKFWPGNLHIIGKDILRFHAAIWPAMLLSAGLELPHELYVHGFINAPGGLKMSKSLGNVVDPLEIVEEYGTDAFRYYLLREIPSGQDGEFSFERFNAVYNADLANELGNLVQRTAAMINKYLGGQLGNIEPHSHDVMAYREALKQFKFDAALGEVWLLVKGLNQYIEEEKPWALAKTDSKQLKEVLHHVVADLLQVADLLLPFLPETAGKIIKTLGGDLVDSTVGILFPKLETSEPLEHTELDLPA